ncbi:unnamed protein product, partial [Ectocarpus sp. 4 AP-2014]
ELSTPNLIAGSPHVLTSHRRVKSEVNCLHLRPPAPPTDKKSHLKRLGVADEEVRRLTAFSPVLAGTITRHRPPQTQRSKPEGKQTTDPKKEPKGRCEEPRQTTQWTTGRRD